MDYSQVEDLLSEIISSLNSINNGSYKKILQRHENSIDFITNGEVKKIVGIKYTADPRLSIYLQPDIITLRDSLRGIRLNVGAQIQMKDFTNCNDETIQFYDLFYQSSYKLLGPKQKYWHRQICNLNDDVRKTVIRLQRKFTPSHRLSKIVGYEPKPKYQILDAFSEYIISNNLKMSNGAIKIEGDLEPFYSKNIFTVCENTIFDTLRENTLLTETQLKLISKISVTKQFSPSRRKMLNRTIYNNGAEYLEGPITL